MPRLWLVRHGRAASAYDAHPDPGLDELGEEQARAVAGRLATIGPAAIVASPLQRARETAMPLERLWGTEATVEPRVAEIPSPTDDLEARGVWVRETMASSWDALGAEHQRWRDAVVQTLLGLESDTVVFTHFIAINAALGSARGDTAVVTEMLGNGSVTTLDSDGTTLSVVDVEAGDAGHVN